MSQVTTHVLDTTKGEPAKNVSVVLYQLEIAEWLEIAAGTTNSAGRIPDLLKDELLLPSGTYKLKFLTNDYFDQSSVRSFYPFVEIIFEITTQEHYHIPLLLNPFGYTTYRGS